MRLTLEGKYRDNADAVQMVLADADARMQAIQQAQELLGGYWQMKLVEFFDTIHNKPRYQGNDISVAELFWLAGLNDFVQEFHDSEEALRIPTSLQKQYEIDAEKSCLPMTIEENMQVFMVDFFGLHSFDDALSFTLYEYHLARKVVYNRNIYQRRCNQLQEEKLKSKRK